MHRVESAGHVGNRFSEGNPATGQQATVLPAAWLNSVQEEIVTVIEEAGITLKTASTEEPNQLLAAIQALITGGGAGQATVTSAGVVELATGLETRDGLDGTRAVTPAGLDSRTATESRTGLIELATTAEVKGLIDTLRAVTPARLGEIFDMRSWSTDDYVRIPDVPGGLIIQWGTVSVAIDQSAPIIAPVAFNTACLAGIATLASDCGPASDWSFPRLVLKDKTTTGATVVGPTYETTGSPYTVQYILIGY